MKGCEIWSTVIHDIPILKNQIQKIIEEIETNRKQNL